MESGLYNIIILAKTEKLSEYVKSYRPLSIRILPIIKLSKGMQPFIEENGVVPDHQFGFR